MNAQPAQEVITFSCFSCGTTLQVDARLAGQSGPCPVCSTTISAPRSESQQPSPAAGSQPQGYSQSSPPQHPSAESQPQSSPREQPQPQAQRPPYAGAQQASPQQRQSPYPNSPQSPQPPPYSNPPQQSPRPESYPVSRESQHSPQAPGQGSQRHGEEPSHSSQQLPFQNPERRQSFQDREPRDDRGAPGDASHSSSPREQGSPSLPSRPPQQQQPSSRWRETQTSSTQPFPPLHPHQEEAREDDDRYSPPQNPIAARSGGGETAALTNAPAPAMQRPISQGNSGRRKSSPIRLIALVSVLVLGIGYLSLRTLQPDGVVQNAGERLMAMLPGAGNEPETPEETADGGNPKPAVPVSRQNGEDAREMANSEPEKTGEPEESSAGTGEPPKPPELAASETPDNKEEEEKRNPAPEITEPELGVAPIKATRMVDESGEDAGTSLLANKEDEDESEGQSGKSASPGGRLGPPRFAMQQFLHASSWEDRVEYVHNGEELKGEIQAYYQDHPDESVLDYRLDYFHNESERGMEVYVFFLTFPGGKEGFPVMILEEDGEYGLNWGLYVEFKDRHFSKFVEAQQKEPESFRVVLQRVTYWEPDREEIPNVESLACYRIDPPYPGFTQYAFVDKESEVGKRVLGQLSWEAEPLAAEVELHWAEFENGRPYMTIDRIVARSWVR